MQRLTNPILYFENNMIFNDVGCCWAVYKLDGMNYDYCGIDEKLQILGKLARFISSFERGKLLIIPTKEDVQTHFGKLRKEQKSENPVYSEAIEYLNATEEYLNANSDFFGNGYCTYLTVKLKAQNFDFKSFGSDAIKSFFKEPLKNLTEFMTSQPFDIPLYKYNDFKKQEYSLLKELATVMEISRVTAGETQWLLKRSMYRGLDTPVEINKTTKLIKLKNGKVKKVYSNDWTPKAVFNKKYIRPEKNDVVNMFNGIISCKKRAVCVHHDNSSTSYQSFLCLTHMPDDMDFPGNEWIYNLQNFEFASEVCIDIENVEIEQAKRTISSKQQQINSEIEEASFSSVDTPSELFEGKLQGEQLKNEIENSKMPISKVTFSVCLSASSLEALEEQVAEFRNIQKNINFIYERSISDQLNLFMTYIPGSESYVNSYQMSLSPYTLAGGIFGVNNRLGDDVGYYIGTNSANGSLVKLYLGLANLMNKSASATFYGDLGYGKSFNANLLLYLHVLFGASGLVFDPKSERSNWVDLPLIGHMVNIITIDSSDKFKGVLDPFNLYKDDIERACEVAQSVLMDLFRIEEVEDRADILSFVLSEIKLLPTPSMQKLVELLGEYKNNEFPEFEQAAKKLAFKIKNRKEIGFNKLLFGNGTERGLNFTDGLNIVQIHNLKIPDKDVQPSDYKKEEHLSSIIMGVLGDFSKQFAMQIKNKLKVILFDESWFMAKSAAGLDAINYLSRTGRSLFSSVLLNGHSVLDLPSEATENTITYKFCFHTSNAHEAERMLEYLKLDVSEENKNILMNLGNGECLFMDLYGRVGRLKFDAVFEDLINAFSTTPIDNTKNEVYDEVAQSKSAPEIKHDTPHEETEKSDVVYIPEDVLDKYNKIMQKYGKQS